MANTETTTTTVYKQAAMPWIFSDAYFERLQKIKSKHGFGKKHTNQFNAFVADVMSEKITLSAIRDVARTSLFLNKEEATLLARDIIGHLVLPIAFLYHDDSFALLRQWAGALEDYPMPEKIESILEQVVVAHDFETEAENIERLQKEIEAGTQEEQAEEISASPEKSQQLEQQLKDLYTAVQTDAMKQARDRFAKAYADTKEFTKAFYQVINDRDVDGVIGALWVIAQKGELTSLLVNDSKIQSLYSKHLAKKFSQEVSEHFDLHPEEPAYLSIFLQYLLQETLKMNESDAAALAIHLLNEERKVTHEDIPHIAYGDMSSATFKWNEVTIQDNHLKLA